MRTPLITTAIRTQPRELTVASSSLWDWARPVLGISLFILLSCYWQTVVSMAAIWWRSDTYAHGMVVLPISLYLIWRQRHILARLEPHSNWFGLIPLALACLGGWLAAYAADVLVVQQFALITMLLSLVYTLLGRQVSWAIAFPLAYLFFAVPVGEALTLPLQDFTALFSVKLLRLTGVPVFWEGYRISLPTGEFEVAEACSGLRYLIASLALGCLYAYLTYHSLWRRLAFIALAVVMPIVANGVRAYGIVMLAYLSSGQLATGVDHIIYGWFFFGLVMLLMFWIGSFWREPDQKTLTVPVAATSTGVPGTSDVPGRLVTTAIAGLLIVALGPVGAARLNNVAPSDEPILLQAPPASPPWTGPAASDDDWQPVFVGADATLHRVYRWDDHTVQLYIAFYSYPRQNAKLVTSANTLYDGKRWLYVDERIRTIALATATRQLTETRISAGPRKRLIWHWYWVAGRTTTSGVETKLLEAWERLSGMNRGSAIVAVVADYEMQSAEAETLLQRFLDTMATGIETTLERQQPCLLPLT